jgi:hypothetical protein
MTETQIGADWAWISKDPAEGIGYTVLKTSADDVDFRPFIGHYVAGAPSSTTPPDAPDAPPWVTFGPVATERDGVLMSVSVRDPWRVRDDTGRPVWPQRLFVMRFDDLAGAKASYQTMWTAARPARVPRDEPGPLQLEVPEQATGALAATIERYGLSQLGALAAALLDGPVAVSDAAGLGRDERLAVLDAVAALLPYGFRADLSASSVVDNTVKHGIRLTFADYPGPGQQLCSLRELAPAAGSELGQRYLAMLEEKAAARGLPAVVNHLWAFWHPCSFMHPDAALTLLSELDFYGGFRKALRKGQASREEVLKFFADQDRAREQWAAFDPKMRENAISPYLADRDEEVLVAVLRCWDFSHPEIVQVINHHLGARGPRFAVWCLRTAGTIAEAEIRRTVVDQLLGKMLVPVGLGPQEYSERIATLVQLLRSISVPAPAHLSYTCEELRYGDLDGWQSHLVRELLAVEAAQGDRVVPWVRWLCQSPSGISWERPSWIAALDFMLAPSAADSARAVIRQDAAWTAVLLRVAGRFGCLAPLIVAAREDLIKLAVGLPAPHQAGSPAAALSGELDRDLWQLDVPAPTVAAADVVRVLLGGSPRDLAGRLTEKQLDSYGDGLNPVLALDILAPRRPAIERAYLRHVVAGKTAAGLGDAGVWLLNSWAVDPDRIAGLGDFIAALSPTARPYDEKLNEAYWEALARRPGLADYAAAQQLVIATRESARNPQEAFRRRLVGNGMTSTPLARACLRARRTGLPPAGIVSALANGGANRIAPRQLDNVLTEFQELLACYHAGVPAAPGRVPEPDPGQAADADLHECRALIVWGGLGDTYGEDFRRYLVERLRQDGLTRRRLARAFRKARRKRGRADRGEWVVSVIRAGVDAPPWYRRWWRRDPRPPQRRPAVPASEATTPPRAGSR